MSDGESQSILCWLQALPEALPAADDDCPPLPPPSSPSSSRPNKRKAQHQQPSPPISLSEMEKETDLTPTRKRQRIADATGTSATDPNQTPRPPLRTRRSSASASGSLSASSASASSSRSGSPKKQFMNLRIQESGIEFRTLDAAPKEEAANLLNNLRQIGRGLAILPTTSGSGYCRMMPSIPASGLYHSRRLAKLMRCRVGYRRRKLWPWFTSGPRSAMNSATKRPPGIRKCTFAYWNPFFKTQRQTKPGPSTLQPGECWTQRNAPPLMACPCPE